MAKRTVRAAPRRSTGAITWRVDVLGHTQLTNVERGEVVAVSMSQRRLLAILALHCGRPVEVDVVIDAMWPGRPPVSARASLHNAVSRLRSATYNDIIASTVDAYALNTVTDAVVFERAVADGVEQMEAHPAVAAEQLTRALGLIRGEPFADIDHVSAVSGTSVALKELHQRAEISRARAWLRSDNTEAAIVEAERLVGDLPIDESRWALLIEALHAAGRRGDALAAHARATRQLRDYLGVAPGALLQDLHRQLLVDPVQTADIAVLKPTGREAIITRLVTMIDEGESVVIAGEDGSGRSTVAREVWRLLRRRGMRSVFVAVQDNSPSATAVLDDVLEELGMPRLVGIDVADTFLRRVLGDAEHDPMVIVVDDVVRAGPSTIGVLEQCARHRNVRLVTTVGLAEGVPTALAGHRVEVLEPLSDDAVQSIVREAGVLRGGIDAEGEDTVVSLAGGNPLLLAHLLGEWQHDSSLSRERKHAAVSVSDGLAAVVGRMLAPCGSAVRRAVDVAAVIGRSGPIAVWEELATPAAVAGALNSGLMDRRGDEFVFRHGAVARVRAAAVPGGMRDDVLRGFADAARRRLLPVHTYVEQSYATASLNPTAAYDDCMAAGVDASDRGLHRDAVDWYERSRAVAQEFMPSDSIRSMRARIRAGDAKRLSGDPSHVAELLACAEESLRTANPSLVTESAYALLQFGGTSQRGAAQQQAMHFARRAMRALDGREEWALVAAATTLTLSLFDDPTEPRRDFARALQVARDSGLRMRILPYAYMTFGHPRDLDRRAATATELMQLAHEAQNPSALFSAHHQFWANALVTGDAQAMAKHHSAMESLVERIGTVGARWEVLSSYATRLIADGELAMAERVAHEAHDVLAPMMSERAAAVLMSHLFAIRRLQDQLAELEPVLANVVARQPSIGALRALYAATLVSSDPARAASEALAASAMMHEDFTWLAAQFVVGEVLVRTRTSTLASTVLASLEPWEHLQAAPITCSFGPVRDVVHDLRELVATAR